MTYDICLSVVSKQAQPQLQALNDPNRVQSRDIFISMHHYIAVSLKGS